MTVMAEAFGWWNSTVSGLPAEHRPPRCTVPEATTCVFAKILPILSINVRPTKSDQEYWNDLRMFVARFLCTQSVPDPLTEFSEFLVFLYNKKGVLCPKNVNDCIQFFTHMSLV